VEYKVNKVQLGCDGLIQGQDWLWFAPLLLCQKNAEFFVSLK
jgi:hypothetical protein